MNEYLIRYRGLFAGGEAKFTCTSMSEDDALMCLVNRELVHHVISVERVKE